ncbi:Non-specific serine/threonine protein kinase [Bertholletia excelsa]
MLFLYEEFSGIVCVNFLLFLSFIGDVAGTQFDFGTLTLSSLKLLGDAHLNNGSVRLTRDLAVPNSGAGKALYSEPIRFRQTGTRTLTSFSTFFSFSATNLNPSSIGGGLAFLIAPDDEALGDAGGYLGLLNQKNTINGTVAIEFDTLMDMEFKDINGNHVGVDLNSMVSSQVADLEAVGIDIKSGKLVNSWVDYSGLTQSLNVSVSYSNLKPREPVLSFTLDLDQYASDFMFVGFSGSTQGSTEIHSIEWWSFTSSFDLSSPLTPTANSTNRPPCNTTSKCHSRFCKGGSGAVVGIITAGALILAFFTIALIWVYSQNFKSVNRPEFLTAEIIKMPKEFTHKELTIATEYFNSTRIIGKGAFGTVYKGVLPETGDMVAVKRCGHSGQGKTEFLSELSTVGSLRHRNLLRLQGWCQEKGEILLVYELMPNGSLDKALFESKMILPWSHRRKILMGVASALAYLHHDCENQVIHRDVKTSNIMLDREFNAKLSDFGLAREIGLGGSPSVAGTLGYLAPEYLLTGRASENTDVFSFGAVVLEVASGRRPIEEYRPNLVEWVWALYREGRLLMAADPRLGEEFDEVEMTRVLKVGLACSHPDPVVRPKMRSVTQMLLGEAEVLLIEPRAKPTLGLSTSQLLLSLQESDSVSDLNGVITMSSPSQSEDSFSGGVGIV